MGDDYRESKMQREIASQTSMRQSLESSCGDYRETIKKLEAKIEELEVKIKELERN